MTYLTSFHIHFRSSGTPREPVDTRLITAMLKEGPLAVSPQVDSRFSTSYHNAYTSGNSGFFNMDATKLPGNYNSRAIPRDSPESSSDSKSPTHNAIPTCVVTPTATEKGYISYEEDGLGNYIPSRKQREFIPDNKKDAGYWEKRRKNNEAARRSREKRRYHDMALENRIMDLTRDNCKLRNELSSIKKRFGIPLNETFVSDDDDPPLHRPQQLPTVSPTRPQTQHAMPPAILSSALQHRGPSVHESAIRARSYSGSLSMPYRGSYPTTKPQNSTYQTSVSSIDSYYTNSGHRDSNSNIYPGKVEPQDYSTMKSMRDVEDTIPHGGRSELTERSAYSDNVPPSMVPRYNSSIPGTTPTSYWAPGMDMTSSDSNDEGDWGDQIQDEPLSLVKKNTENNSSNSDVSNNSSRASNSPTSSSSLPLKLRHKLPQDNTSTTFPPTSNIPAYANGLAQLSEIALAQSNLPHSSADDYNIHSPEYDEPFGYRSGSFSNPRAGFDTKYVERRRKNNEAARKCRENRKKLTRIREVKSGYLESENGKLKDELSGLQEEMKQLREMLEKKRQTQGFNEEENDEKSDDDRLVIETKNEPMDERDSKGE